MIEPKVVDAGEVMDRYSSVKHIKAIPMILESYQKAFNILPVRIGKEDKFDMGNGSFKTIKGIWYDLYPETKSKSMKKEREEEVRNEVRKTQKTDVITEKKERKSPSKTTGVSYKQLCKDLITSGLTEPDVKKTIIERYVADGHTDTKWMEARAKAIYYHVKNK